MVEEIIMWGLWGKESNGQTTVNVYGFEIQIVGHIKTYSKKRVISQVTVSVGKEFCRRPSAVQSLKICFENSV